ncbi:MAG TPA: MBL fold metallo-hydrolase [bacterium]|nr:MBL fold metallo-hydrolase [bacterium]
MNLIDQIDAASVPSGSVGIWFLGQASVVLRTERWTIYIDPYLSDFVERVTRARGEPIVRRYPSLVDPAAVRNADLVLVTHDHEDHLDLDTLPIVAGASPQARFVLPGRSARILAETGIARERILVPPAGETIAPLPGLTLAAIPAAHEELEQEPGLGHRFFGYVLDAQGVRVYHSGDTLVYPGLPELLQRHRVAVGLVVINGRDYVRRERGIVGNMTSQEAADLADAAGFDLTIPLHYDLFERNGERPGKFVDDLYERHPHRTVLVLGRGAGLLYTPQKPRPKS